MDDLRSTEIEEEERPTNRLKSIFIGGGVLAAFASICCAGAVATAFLASWGPFQSDVEVYSEMICEKAKECDIGSGDVEECTEMQIKGVEEHLQDEFDACGKELLAWHECTTELVCRDWLNCEGGMSCRYLRHDRCGEEEQKRDACLKAAGFEPGILRPYQ